MYLRKIFNKKTGRTYLSIVKGFRDPESKKVKQKTVKSLGYLDELEKDFDDPIAHFENLAKEMTEEDNEAKRPLTFTFNSDEKINSTSTLRKNLGYSVLGYFCHKLKIDEFFINRQSNLDIKYSLNNIFLMLVYSRALFTYSKKRSFENMDYFFADFDFKLEDIYGALHYFNFYKNDLLLHTHEMVRVVFGRNMSNVYYDITNYHFEFDSDDFHKKDLTKEHYSIPLVQMGLLIDNSGLPITYRLIEGNAKDYEALMPVLHDLKNIFGLNRIILIADKEMNNKENIANITLNRNGYIFSQIVREANADFQDFILSDQRYTVLKDGLKIKSRIVTTDIWVKDVSNKRVKVPIEQKQVALFSPDYAKRAQQRREETLVNAKKIIATNKNGNEDMDSIDYEKINEDMKFDGYYAIVTSELGMTDTEILSVYRGWLQIEEAFEITKSDLNAKPTYVSSNEYIESHFLICFTSLLLLRLLEMRTEHRYPIKELINQMRNITGSYLDENIYMLDNYNHIVESLGKAVGIDFSRRFMTLGDIKKILADTKK